MFRGILFAAVVSTAVSQAANVRADEVKIDNFTFTPLELTIKMGAR